MKNMYGSTISTSSRRYLAVQTYYIDGDQFGTLQAVFRLVETALRLLRIRLDTLNDYAATKAHRLWIQALYQAYKGASVQLGELAQHVVLHPGQPLLNQFNIALQSLPPAIQLECFTTRFLCSCGYREDIIVPLGRAVDCSSCGAQMRIYALPKLALLTQQQGIRFPDGDTQYQLLSAVSQRQALCSQLLCDLFSKRREMSYLLQTVYQQQQAYAITDLVYLDPGKALQWISQSKCKAEDQFGRLYLYVYFDLKYAEVEVQENARLCFSTIYPQTQPISILKTPKYVYSPVIENDRVMAERSSSGVTAPLAAADEDEASSIEPESESLHEVVEELVQRPTYTYKKISIYDLQPAMIILLAGILLLVIIDVVLASVLTERIRNVMPVANLVVSEKAYLGVDPAYMQPVSMKRADSSTYSIITASLYADQLNAATVSSANATFSALANRNAVLPSAIKSLIADTVEVKTFESALFKSQTSLDFYSNINASGLEFSSLNYQQFTTTGTLTTNQVNTTLFQANNLNVAYSLNSKQINASAVNSTTQMTVANQTTVGDLRVSTRLQINDSMQLSYPITFDGSVTITNQLRLNDQVQVNVNQSAFYNAKLSMQGQTVTINNTLNVTDLYVGVATAQAFSFANSSCSSCGSLNIAALNISNTLRTAELVHLGANSSITDLKATNSTLSALKTEAIEINSSGMFGTTASVSLGGVNISDGVINSPGQINFSGSVQLNGGEVHFANAVAANEGVFRTINTTYLNAVYLNVSGASSCANATIYSLNTTGDYTAQTVSVDALALRIPRCSTANMLCSSRHCDADGCRVLERVNGKFMLRGDDVTGTIVCQENVRAGPNGGCWA